MHPAQGICTSQMSQDRLSVHFILHKFPREGNKDLVLVVETLGQKQHVIFLLYLDDQFIKRLLTEDEEAFLDRLCCAIKGTFQLQNLAGSLVGRPGRSLASPGAIVCCGNVRGEIMIW